MPQWKVQGDTIVLGFFSFAKLMMYRDLEPDRWPPSRGLREHPLIRGLLGDGFRGQSEPLAPDDAPVDTVIDISSAGHVVDADSSQMLAIEDVRAGRDLVIQGPPGTGKSQTITNLIALAVRHGKRVLFVAEKMAALNVVRSNLDRIGLGHICLELHSHKAKKKAVLADLEQTYQLARARRVPNTQLADQLRAARDALNDHARRIHTPLEASGATPFAVFGKLARLAGTGLSPPDFQLPAARGWTGRDIDARSGEVERLAAHVQLMGVPSQHPWRHTEVDVVLPQDAERIAARAQVLHQVLSDLIDRGTDLSVGAGASCNTLAEARQLVRLGETLAAAPIADLSSIANDVWANRRAEIAELIGQGATYAKARGRVDGVLLPEAWEQDLAETRRFFALHGRSWLRWLRPEYRAATARFRSIHVGPPPRSVVRRLELLHALATGQRARERVRSLDALGRAAFGRFWIGDASDWALLANTELWERQARATNLPPGWQRQLATLGDVAAFVQDTAAFGTDLEAHVSDARSLLNELSFDVQAGFAAVDFDSVSLSTLCDRYRAFAVNPERLQQWCTWRIWAREAREQGLGEVVDRLADGRLQATHAVDVFHYACYEALARQVFAEHRELLLFDGRSHERVLSQFQGLDRQGLELARREVEAQHADLIPKGDREVGEIGILAREWRKQRRHLPLRQLTKAAGRAMQLIKPVWMMSPMSLAQFAEPGALQFDLVLMDEASQIRPVEAIGAVARGKQLVVVGDERQLPPTSFFDRVVAEDTEPSDAEDFQAADVESILGLCTAQGIPDRMLRWHYRSQHESLIAVSNLEFYRRLFIVPSALSEELGLRFRKVNGVYDRGRSATNRVEAQEVAQAVLEHAHRYGRSARFPDGLSLGVGTFSVSQRDAILDELELLWRQHPEVAAFFDANAPEPFFVKNLESIQGDERDVVFISVGYGRDADGYLAMGFGPLATQGGERRLNVLISRARRRCEVFSSIAAGDIDLARAQSIGVRVLKTFLHYAETGQLERSQIGERPIDSDFEVDVGTALAGAGYQVEHQVGVAGFFVDLAIKDPQPPGHYILGIECDGWTYHSSRSARDRDRLREQVLRDRGWRIHRIWSTDWYRRRQEELQRAIRAIEAARSHGSSTTVTPRFPIDAPQPPVAVEAYVHTAPVAAPRHAVATVPYEEASFAVQLGVEPHQLAPAQLADVLIRIVAVEGPIHREELGRRYATMCGKDRTGSRIQDAVSQALASAVGAGELHAEGEFYTLSPVLQSAPRDRSATRSPTLRRPDMLPRVEIETGLYQVVADHVGVEPQAAIVEVARLLGFQRTGQELKRTIEDQVREMIGKGILVLRNGNRLYIP